MAKIGSMELIVILIIALFAIGPERLPKAARMLGRAVRSFKKYMNDATSELREVSEEFKDVTNEIASAQKTMKQAFLEADDELKKTERDINSSVNGKKPDAAEAKHEAEDKAKEAAAKETAAKEAAPQAEPAQETADQTDDSEQQDAAAAV